MRITKDKSLCGGQVFYLKSDRHVELAYMILGFRGLELTIEFPSDWSEDKRGWFRVGLGLTTLCVSFRWFWFSKDEGQCSGHTYGFKFFKDLFWIYYGKGKGKRDDPHLTLYMPWHWKFVEHKVLSEPETHPYRYLRKNGAIQNRRATIYKESRLWKRWWLPYQKYVESINIEFDEEVGEKSGTHKGGCLGCSYEMEEHEAPYDTLRRMEIERKF